MQDQNIDQLMQKIIHRAAPSNQEQLQQLMREQGIELTQASISRHLKKANIRKIDGCYRLPEISNGESQALEFLKIIPAGENLLVIKTPIGSASRAGYIIDSSKVPGIAGTISGDDTIFIALTHRNYASSVTEKILNLFLQKE